MTIHQIEKVMGLSWYFTTESRAWKFWVGW